MKKNNQDLTKQKNYKLGLILILLAISAAVFYAVAEFRYQQSISSIYGLVKELKQQVVEMEGGVEFSAPTTTHGAYLISKLSCIDINCPQVESTWLIPIESGKYQDFENKANQKIQLLNINHFRVSLFGPEQLNGKNPPRAAPEGKEWVVVRIFVYE